MDREPVVCHNDSSCRCNYHRLLAQPESLLSQMTNGQAKSNPLVTTKRKLSSPTENPAATKKAHAENDGDEKMIDDASPVAINAVNPQVPPNVDPEDLFEIETVGRLWISTGKAENDEDAKQLLQGQLSSILGGIAVLSEIMIDTEIIDQTAFFQIYGPQEILATISDEIDANRIAALKSNDFAKHFQNDKSNTFRSVKLDDAAIILRKCKELPSPAALRQALLLQIDSNSPALLTIDEALAGITLKEKFESAILHLSNEWYHEVCKWPFLAVGDRVYEIGLFRKTKSGFANAACAYMVEVQMPLGGGFTKLKKILDSLEQGRYAQGYGRILQIVIRKDGTKSSTLKGKYKVFVCSQIMKDELLTKYPRSTRDTRKGFFIEKPYEERKL